MVPGEFPAQRPVTRSFDVFFDLRLNKRLSKQSWGWWFETISRPLWGHCNGGLCETSHVLTLRPRQDGNISFSNKFPLKKIVLFLFKFHWNLFPRVQLTKTTSLVQTCSHNLLTFIAKNLGMQFLWAIFIFLFFTPCLTFMSRTFLPYWQNQSASNFATEAWYPASTKYLLCGSPFSIHHLFPSSFRYFLRMYLATEKDNCN